MKSAILLLACAIVLVLAQCSSDSGSIAAAKPKKSAAAPAPAQMNRLVSLPVASNSDESRCLEGLVSTLKEAGFKPTPNAGSPYQLELHVTNNAASAGAPSPVTPVADAPAGARKSLSIPMADGPLHCTVDVVLRKGARKVASAHGEHDAPRASGFSAEHMVESALNRCLSELSTKLGDANELGTKHAPTPEGPSL